MLTQTRRLIEGRLHLQARDPTSGALITERRAKNSVLRSGAELVAGLFDGSRATPVNGFAVGLNPDPPEPPYEAGELTTTAGDGTALITLAATALGTDAITTTHDPETFRIVLSIQGVMPADRAVSPDADVDDVLVGEAALGVLAGDGNSLETLYNRVVFEPIPKRRTHELAFFWEIDFPFGT